MARRKKRKKRRSRKKRGLSNRTLVRLTGFKGRNKHGRYRVTPASLYGTKKRKSTYKAGLSKGIKLGKKKAAKKRRKRSVKKGYMGRYYPPGYQDIWHSNLGKFSEYKQPVIGGMRWLATRQGLWGVGGVIGGQSLARLSNAVINEYLFTGKPKDDPLTNILGDALGAIAGWELGRLMKNQAFGQFAAASAISRFAGEAFHDNVTTPMMKNIAPQNGATEEIQAEAAKNAGGNGGTQGLGYSYGDYTINGPRMGQVRIPDDTYLSQIRIPESAYLGQNYANPSDEYRVNGLSQVRAPEADASHFDLPYGEDTTLFG